MTDSQTPTYRSHTTPTGDRIEYRQSDEEDGVYEVRMPIATTGEVRNDGDDPLSRSELDGMARQINDGGLGVFLDHGSSELGGPQPYSAVGKIGEWTDATVDGERDDGEDALMATARLMDPESLPNGVKELRAAVGAIQEQVRRGFSISASIGWREDDAYPGGNDLMEASIVGIGADPRTVSNAGEDAGVVARAAVAAGADPDTLLAQVRDAIDDGVGERGVTPQQAEQAIDLIDQFLDAQGDATVRNFEDWLWEIDDEEADDNAIHAARTALQEFYRDNSPMDEPVEESFRDWINAQMSDDDDTGDDEAGTTDEEQDASGEEEDETTEERQEAPEWVSELRDLLESIHDAVREDDEDEDEEQETDEDDEEEDDDSEQSVDEDVAERIAELESELEQVRNGEVDIESPGDADTDEEQDATTDADGEDGDPLAKYNLASN